MSSALAKGIYQYLLDHENAGYLKSVPAEDGIAEIEGYLSDLTLVKETIRDIENISD